MRAVSALVLVRIVFGALVVATFGAFFVTQRLKTSTPVVERVFFHQYVSPNGDGRKDRVRMRFDLPEDDRVTVEVVDERGESVRELAEDVPRGVDRAGLRWRGASGIVVWDGRDDAGRTAPDGIYRLRVTLRGEGRAVTAPRELTLDTAPPRPAVVAVSPPTFVPGAAGGRGRVRIRYRGPQDPAPLFRVYRTDVGGRSPELVAAFRGPRFRETAEWDGSTSAGTPAPDGVYAFAVTVQDKAGNRGSAPAVLPPTRRAALERTGASIRYLSASGPLVPVRAGAVAQIAIGPIDRRLRWTLRRAGAPRAIARGQARGRAFGVRVPSDARTGVYYLGVRGGGRTGTVPLVVRGRGRGRVLVVLPAVTWQGLNPADDDRDGFPDTLEVSATVGAGEAPARAALPAGVRRDVAPLLRLLERRRLAYDITTDLALARGEGPRIGGRPGVMFPGGARWFPEEAGSRLREYVEGGGRVAWFGTDAFRRRVTVGAEELLDPSAPEVRNLFGEAAAPKQLEETSLVVDTDRIGMFRGTDGFIGLFSAVEDSRALAPGTRVVAAAGAQGATGFIAYRLGDGLVVRVGAPGWARQVFSRPEVGRVTERIWELLAR